MSSRPSRSSGSPSARPLCAGRTSRCRRTSRCASTSGRGSTPRSGRTAASSTTTRTSRSCTRSCAPPRARRQAPCRAKPTRRSGACAPRFSPSPGGGAKGSRRRRSACSPPSRPASPTGRSGPPSTACASSSGRPTSSEAGLRRMGRWEGFIRRALRERGVPEDLVALPHVESSYNPAANSHAGAAGLWQFMRPTARLFMRVDYLVDERLDPYTASEGAARLLREQLRAARHLAPRDHRLQPRAGGTRQGRAELRHARHRHASSRATRARRSASRRGTSTRSSWRRAASTATPCATSGRSGRTRP